MNPEDLDKYIYVTKTPNWLVRTVYITGIMVLIPVFLTTFRLFGKDPFFTWLIIPTVSILTIQFLVSFILNLFYKQFDIPKHIQFAKKFWAEHDEPSVDVYLPICGEDMPTLLNTWKYVSRLNYKNKRVYVLDDSKDERDVHEHWAKYYGFDYISRPNRGEMKKAGNLKYAYERTSGEFIAILDADFAPRSDYLYELLPYMSDKRVGIVQSPQFFSMDVAINEKSPLAYGATRAQEIFYRVIQVARDRLGGTHCCGTCAIYRREALASIGGFVQMGHSEDAHTGLGIAIGGYTLRYIPLIVSVGLSPDDPHAFLHQQHRWCLGNMIMMVDPKFWRAPISWKIKFCYISGYLFYLQQPFIILFSFELFWILFFYSKSISLTAGLPFYPHVIWSFAYMFLFYIAPFRWGYLYSVLLRMFSYCHAIATTILGGTVGWIATNAKFAGVSAAYRQTVAGVGIYILAYLACVAVAIRMHVFHLLNFNYYIVEFWIFFNLILTAMLLWLLYRKMDQTQQHLVAEGELSRPSFLKWKLKTSGAYTALAIGIFFAVIYLPIPNNLGESRVIAQVINVSSTPVIVYSSTTPFSFSVNHQIYDSGPDILALQQFLNSQGFIVAKKGPGSPGNETPYFGQRTYQALIKFQRANNLSSTGYLGWQTRDFINSGNYSR